MQAPWSPQAAEAEGFVMDDSRDPHRTPPGLPPIQRWQQAGSLADPGEDRYYQECLASKPQTREVLQKWAEREGFPHLLALLEKWNLMPSGDICELGAGHCWFSAVMSLREHVRKIYAVDACEAMLEKGALATFEWLGCCPEKIQRIVGDFHNLQLPDESVDWVVFDASLHHAANPARALSEAYRILRPGGQMIAMRERTLPRLRWRSPFNNPLDRELRAYGEFEHVYPAARYVRLIREAGFQVQVRRIFRSRRKFGLPYPAWLQALPPFRWREAKWLFRGVKPAGK